MPTVCIWAICRPLADCRQAAGCVVRRLPDAVPSAQTVPPRERRCVAGRGQAFRARAAAARRREMDFVILPGALCFPMTTDRKAAPGRLPGAGAEIFRPAGREWVR